MNMGIGRAEKPGVKRAHEERKVEMKKSNVMETIMLVGTVIVCTLIMVSLCFDNMAMDFDEAYSYATVNGNSLMGICRDIIAAHDTDIPLWYLLLRVWTYIFGESWLAYKLFSVAGNVATMVLGVTVVRRNWGYLTAQFFVIAASLAPVMLHIGVNVRMYSWTGFFVTASGLIIYELLKKPEKGYLWGLLLLTTICALLSHYFTAFCFLVLYLYLLLELFFSARKHLWKVFACGIVSLIPFGIWVIISDLFHLYGMENETGAGGANFYEFFDYIFGTDAPYSWECGVLFFGAILAGIVLLRKRFAKAEWRFTLMSFGLFITCYLLGALVSTMSSHFYTPRHVMHGVPLMWLGISILLSRAKLPAYISGLVFLLTMCVPNYQHSYALEYETAPYLEETRTFIAENMQPGDVVLYNAAEKFDLLYRCYMPEQEFFHLEEVTDIEMLIGRRVWFLYIENGAFFTPEQLQAYGISCENLGHYGFQIINDCTDFDLLRLEIGGGKG